MAKLIAVSLQKYFPIVSEYTEEEITSDGAISKITKSSCISHPSLANASATLLTSWKACYTLQCWNLLISNLQSASREE